MKMRTSIEKIREVQPLKLGMERNYEQRKNALGFFG